jgi:CPA1 family monovalent cation:H+ antiporter
VKCPSGRRGEIQYVGRSLPETGKDEGVKASGLGISVERFELLLLVAAVVAMLARRVNLPYTVGLVAAGAALALSPLPVEIRLTKELIFAFFLPPLVFEAAFYIHWHELRRDLIPILVLATVGVLLVAAVTASGMHYLAGWQWTSALLFGVLISATDPVSVIAMFKEAGIHGRLRLLVEAESLFNDGTAAVLFTIALAAIEGGAVGGGSVVAAFAGTVAGGVVCGLVVGGAVLLLTGRTDDHLVEITFTTIAAYGSFLLAEHIHVSGVLATMTAGILVGNVGSLGAISDRGREEVAAFWEYVTFAVNSLVFLLMGMRLAHQAFAPVRVPILVAIPLVIAARAIAVCGCCALFSRSGSRVARRHQLILVWGGLRGALALALVLGLPVDMPGKAAITAVAFAVVAFSVVVQGLTIMPLLRAEEETEEDRTDEEGESVGRAPES